MNDQIKESAKSDNKDDSLFLSQSRYYKNYNIMINLIRTKHTMFFTITKRIGNLIWFVYINLCFVS